MNATLRAFAVQQIKFGLALCTPEQQLIFKRMYSHLDLEKPIDAVVDAMPDDKLDRAMTQVERTLAGKGIVMAIP